MLNMQALEATLGPKLAAGTLRAMVANCTEADRSTVHRVILGPRP